MNRRAAPKLAPAALMAGAAPTVAECAAPPESRIIELFRRHQKMLDEAECHPMTQDGLESSNCYGIMDRLFYDEIFRIEEEMMSLPCQRPADFAAKICSSRPER